MKYINFLFVVGALLFTSCGKSTYWVNQIKMCNLFNTMEGDSPLRPVINSVIEDYEMGVGGYGPPWRGLCFRAIDLPCLKFISYRLQEEYSASIRILDGETVIGETESSKTNTRKQVVITTTGFNQPDYSGPATLELTETIGSATVVTTIPIELTTDPIER